MDKSGLRQLYIERANKLTNTEKKGQSQALLTQLMIYLNQQSGIWSLYAPLESEPNLLELVEKCNHLKWVFPLVKNKDEALEFYEIFSSDQLEEGYHGVLEPDGKSQRVPLKSINGFIVPGLAFDSSGVRLGRGGGFYDRTLSQTNSISIGVTFDSGLAESLPRENHDQLMNFMASPQAWTEIYSTNMNKEVSNGI